MRIGYVRVSTEQQHTERQQVILNEMDVDKMFVDRCSGKNMNRPQLQEMLSFSRAGDVIVVESISRFARSTRDLLHLIDVLTKKDVQFISKKESLDTSTPSGRFMLTVFGALAELERDQLRQRQLEGISIAKNNGAYHGRKRMVNSEFDRIYAEWIEGRITATQAMKKLSWSKSTFYRRVKERKISDEKIN
ncbi:recombinase family protein [Faecalitalea cylindroides]|uniref:recombinase family protein n=1 Tax=Faecalitalea cylindroides TaxID=39483 RepID=UPI00267573A7|nr:recombinase family protein [Faecalitalea cylindroides]